MRRLTAIALLLGLCIALPAAAQSTLPEYIARDLFCGVEAGVVVFRFNLENTGGDAQDTATVSARRADDNSPLATTEVGALDAGAKTPVELTFPSNLASGALRLNAAVAFSTEDAGNRVQPIQVGTCRVNIPAVQATSAPLATPVPGTSSDWSFGFDLRPEWLAGGVFALCCVLPLIGLLLVLAARLLRRPAPSFPLWQPPYVPQAMLNPATQAGARAGWQEHAASDALPYPCLPFDHAARKILLGMDGVKLHNWRFDGLRAVQYDMYGRIGRTQVIASKGMIKRLNKQLAKSQPRPGKRPRKPESIAKAVGPSAAWLANRLIRSTERTPSLPIALDLRLTGDHGTIRIQFELYTCGDGSWQLIDSWEPEMMLRGGVIAENFSYTFYGRTADESKRALRRRLRKDIAQRLGQMIAQPQPPPPPAKNPPSGMPPEPPVPAGSTAPAAPVTFDQPTPPPTQEIPRVPDAPSTPPEG
ncbi:MAG: hypothetical protein JNL34_11450 [Anaerolineae bacterium]|nr:hypothetical protein [Anaerolineae bacterium]